IRGHGESHLRGTASGDHLRGSKELIGRALEFLDSSTLNLGNARTAVQAVSTLMREIKNLAAGIDLSDEQAPELGALPRPFAGTLLGFEVALLGLAAEAHGTALYGLLSGGAQPDVESVAVLPMLRPSELLDKG